MLQGMTEVERMQNIDKKQRSRRRNSS